MSFMGHRRLRTENSHPLSTTRGVVDCLHGPMTALRIESGLGLDSSFSQHIMQAILHFWRPSEGGRVRVKQRWSRMVVRLGWTRLHIVNRHRSPSQLRLTSVGE